MSAVKPEDKLTALIAELEDAVWCSRGDFATQNDAAKARATAAKAGLLGLFTTHTQKQELQARIGQVQYLYDLRALYDRYELEHKTDLGGNNIATWQGYKFFRNPISDKIEAITGVRSNEDVERWVVAQLKSLEGGDKCKKSNNQNDN